MDTGFRPLSSRKPQRVPINSALSFNLVNAKAGSNICLVSMVLASSGAGTVIFKSNDTEIGRVTFKANDPPMVLGRNADGWLETLEGEALFVANAGALTLTGFATYVWI